MKKIKNLLLIVPGLVAALGLHAQNAPVSTAKPAATVNDRSDLPVVSYDPDDKVNFVRSFDFYQKLSDLPSGQNFTDAINNGNIIQSSQIFRWIG